MRKEYIKCFIGEAVEWVETDPAIKSGRLSYEIKPWYGAKGSVLK